ncbi:MAG: rhodanese-related sulfurtransferase [Gammaproteobacteria bacterium]|nr:rhodanese-related sulfurtransferase [Gammaproteobacteria bacterium]MDH3766905.1 rhodanese-related sulfurtransferase [Gammaproteobacteria bacterium]
MTNVVISFYQFVRLPDCEQLREPLLGCCRENDLRGTILLAPEGINGTLAGRRDGIENVLDFIRSDPRLAELEYKESVSEEMPFHRMKVKTKKEIVTMGVADTDPARLVGTYLDAKAWNEILADPDVVVIDTRNEYEVSIGTFPNSVSPETKAFREFPDYARRKLADKKSQKIAMFCTGGIRCEKATSFLKANGFESVFHLHGGILRYLETVPEKENLWDGECFVFDDRVSVDKGLNKGRYDMCHACRRPINEADKASEHYVAGVSCPHCIDNYSPKQREAFAERERQVRIAESRGQQHIGATMPNKLADDSG